MPSRSLSRWRAVASLELDELRAAHSAIGGTGRGRRYATRQINYTYAVLLASQFQRFCRDLHSEAVDFLVGSVPAPMRTMIRDNLTDFRRLDRQNAQPGSIGADFGRLGFIFWDSVRVQSRRHSDDRDSLDALNAWRNAIAHQDFDPAKLGGASSGLRLSQIQRWRSACNRSASVFDVVVRDHLTSVVGVAPWS